MCVETDLPACNLHCCGQGGVVQLLDAEAAAHIEPGEEAAAGTPAAEQTIGIGRPGQPDPSAQAVIFSSRLHSCPVVSVAVSPAGDRVASLAKDGSVAVLQRDRDDTTRFQVSCLTEVHCLRSYVLLFTPAASVCHRYHILHWRMCLSHSQPPPEAATLALLWRYQSLSRTSSDVRCNMSGLLLHDHSPNFARTVRDCDL